MFFEIGVPKHFAIFTRKRLCWSYFLIKLQGCRAVILLERDSNIDVFLECFEIFKNTYFEEHLRMAASVLLNTFLIDLQKIKTYLKAKA